MKRHLITLIGIMSLVITLRAGTTTFSITNEIAIPDNAYDGTLGSMGSLSIGVPLSGIIQQPVLVTIALSHTWIGDLVIKLKSPGGTLVTLMSRPGTAEVADDGRDITGSGDSSDLAASSPITFDQTSTDSAETMGNTISGSQVVCRDDSRCTYLPDPGSAIPGNLASFTNQNSLGTWTLYVGDAGIGDTGTISSLSITLDTIIPIVPPDLGIAGDPPGVTFNWPTNAPDFTLEAADDLRTGPWTPVGAAPVTSGTNYTVTLTATNQVRLYRLRH